MPLDLTTATQVSAKPLDNGEYLFAWQGTLPADSVWQIYLNRRLAWSFS